MTNSLTNEGQYVSLGKLSSGTGANKAVGAVAGLILAVDALALFSNATTPAKDGTGFTLIAGSGGDPKTIGESNWTASLSGSAPNANVQVVLADQTWTASGAINNIAGAVARDTTPGTAQAMAWWERSSAVSLLTSDQLTADDLTIRLT